MAIVCMHAVMLCSELGTVRLTSNYYRVTGNQELLAAPSETLVRLVEKNEKSHSWCEKVAIVLRVDVSTY